MFKLTEEIHAARQILYSTQENMEIDKVVPVAASVKPKLGKGGMGAEGLSEVLTTDRKKMVRSQ